MQFSIIIPLYNKAPYVEKAIQSVLNQTFEEFELIVIDDGSTDIEAPQPPKGGVSISYNEIETLIGEKGFLVRQPNAGVSTTRNKGVSLAKYNYVAFLDADDWWKPTFLEEMKNLIESFPHAGIYGSSYFKVKDERHISANIGIEQGFKQGLIDYFQVYAKTLWMPLWTGAVIVPRNIFLEFEGFKPKMKLGEDFDLWVRIASKYPVAFLNKPLSYYNQDVDIKNRAVGEKLYQPEEHMLFSDYGNLMENKDFRFLYEKLALYGLLPYYLNNKNTEETRKIIENIDWSKHEKKYYRYYKQLPKCVITLYFQLLSFGIAVKNKLLK